MDLMGRLGRMDKQEVLGFVKSCQHPSGGFGPNPEQDPHILYTLSAVQVQLHLSDFKLVFFFFHFHLVH